MTMRLIPNAAAISEFVAGYNGDCGETAELALLHVINPATYPLNSADLSTIVKRDISKGWASSNGSEPISAIANDLATLGVAHTNYGYAEPFTVDWRGELAQWGGIKPIVFEYARAGALPGDEAGVQYHFNTCLGWDPTANTGLFADGDNIVERDGGTALVRYSEQDLANAGLCGMLVGEYQLGGRTTMSNVPAGWTDDGTTLRAPNGLTVVQGFRTEVLNWPGGWEGNNWPLDESQMLAQLELSNPSLGDGTQQVFRRTVLEWQKSTNTVLVMWVGQELLATRRALAAAQTAEKAAQDQLTAAQTQIANLQQQLAAAQSAPQQPTQPTAQESAALAVVQAIKAALASS